MIKNVLLYEGEVFESSRKKLEKLFILKDIKSKNFKNLKKVSGLLLNLNNHYSKIKLKTFPNLKFILSPTTGLNHIDKDYCNKRNLKIISLKKDDFIRKKIYSTVELSLVFILMAVKKINRFNLLTKNFIWNRYEHKIDEFDNYKIGIIGNGRIGKILCKQLKMLRFNVITFDKKSNEKNLKNLLKSSDVISIHIPAENNKNFINKRILKNCKKNVSIINTSRGEVIDENDLIEFLKINKSSSAFLDVIKDEQKNIQKLRKNKILLYQKKNNNLFITPHIGGVSIQARQITQEIIVNKLIKKNFK